MKKRFAFFILDFPARKAGRIFAMPFCKSDDPPRSGDVEIDLKANGWRAHGHDKNPNFKNVLLHVIWEETKPVESAPTVLSLKNALDAPLAELGLSLENESLRTF